MLQYYFFLPCVPTKVNYAQWNTAWTPQRDSSVSEVRVYILEYDAME
jgi:hypothetical protein